MPASGHAQTPASRELGRGGLGTAGRRPSGGVRTPRQTITWLLVRQDGVDVAAPTTTIRHRPHGNQLTNSPLPLDSYQPCSTCFRPTECTGPSSRAARDVARGRGGRHSGVLDGYGLRSLSGWLGSGICCFLLLLGRQKRPRSPETFIETSRAATAIAVVLRVARTSRRSFRGARAVSRWFKRCVAAMHIPRRRRGRNSARRSWDPR